MPPTDVRVAQRQASMAELLGPYLKHAAKVRLRRPWAMPPPAAPLTSSSDSLMDSLTYHFTQLVDLSPVS